MRCSTATRRKVVAEREKAVARRPGEFASDADVAGASLCQCRPRPNGKSSKTETEKQANRWLEKAKATLAQGRRRKVSRRNPVLRYSRRPYAKCSTRSIKARSSGRPRWRATSGRIIHKPLAASLISMFTPTGATMPQKLLTDYLRIGPCRQGQCRDDARGWSTSCMRRRRSLTRRCALLDTDARITRSCNCSKVPICSNQPEASWPTLRKLPFTTLMQQSKTPELMSALAYVYLNSDRIPQALDLLNQVLG